MTESFNLSHQKFMLHYGILAGQNGQNPNIKIDRYSVEQFDLICFGELGSGQLSLFKVRCQN